MGLVLNCDLDISPLHGARYLRVLSAETRAHPKCKILRGRSFCGKSSARASRRGRAATRSCCSTCAATAPSPRVPLRCLSRAWGLAN